VATGPESLASDPSTQANRATNANAAGGAGSLFDRRELDLMERVHRAEVDALKRGFETEMKEVKELIRAQVAAQASAPAKPAFDFEKFLGAAVTALGPVLVGLTTYLGKKDEKALEMERTRIEREEKRAEASQKRADEQIANISKIMEVNAKVQSTSLESQAVQARSMVQMSTDFASMIAKMAQPESEGIDWGKMIAGALATFATLRSGAGAPVVRRGAAPVAGAPEAPPVQGANGTAAPAPAAPDPNLPNVPAAPELDAIEDRIRAKDPVDQIVADLKALLTAPPASVVDEINALGGLPQVFDDRLGDFSSDRANDLYMKRFTDELQAQGILGAE